MGDKVDPKVLKKTQDALGKIIKKPPLTDKLLSKPPFRFLHDLCTSIIKTTGFMKGLFTDSEMNSDNVKDRDSKVAFLQKAIDLTSLVLGKTLSAKPSKIVAGHEPEKTNEWLQAIAEAIGKKVDNDEYVKRVLTGDMTAPPEKPKEKTQERERSADRRRRPPVDKESPPTKKETAKRPTASSKKDLASAKKDLTPPKPSSSKRDAPKGATPKRKPLDRDEDREKRHRDRKERDSRDRGSREREGSAQERDKRERDGSARSRDKESRDKHRRDEDRKDRHRDKEERQRDRDERHRDEKSRDKERDRRRHREEEDENKENKVETPQSGEGDSEQKRSFIQSKDKEPAHRIPRPSSAKGSRRRQTYGRSRTKDLSDDERPKEEEAPKEATMNGHVEGESAQQSAPRRMARPSSARPAPPRVKQNEPPPEEPAVIGPSNVPNIISDKQDESSDDDDIFVTKEEEEAPAPAPEPTPQVQNEDEEGGEHGGLVKKMMEAKEKLEGGSHAQNQQPKKTEIERSSQVSDATRRKEREMVKKEIEKLRTSIQTLTRSVNPLGKILDFVQEDLDSMQKELELWKHENAQNQVALQREQSITESSVEPLRAHLTEIDNAMKDQLDLIAAVKSNVLKNDEKITKMLGSITKS